MNIRMLTQTEEWAEKFEKAGVTDLDKEVYELKSQEAFEINNRGLTSQIEFLLKECGEDFLNSLLRFAQINSILHDEAESNLGE